MAVNKEIITGKSVDLHIHSNLSDGQYNVNNLLKKIEEANIDIFSITDHDNIDSIKEVKKHIVNNNYIPGVELSTYYNGINCHILGYNINEEAKYINEYCNYIKGQREERMFVMLYKLKKNHNIEFSKKEIEDLFNKTGSIGKPDLVKLISKKNLGNTKYIYNNYLKNIDSNINYRLEAKDCIDAILMSGGIPVLAHPKEIQLEYDINIFEFIKALKKEGLQGIEVYHSIHGIFDSYFYEYVAEKLDLITTGGSDFHGPSIKSNLELGKTTTKQFKIYQKDINIFKR